MRRQGEGQRARGFSLVELLVALAVGSISVVVAAEVARMAVRQSGKGEQVTSLASSARLIGRQIRTDIKLAGYGSTGAIGVDPARQPWATMRVQTAGGFNAIPAVRGADNTSGSIGGVAVLPGSDALQVVVPNPATMVRTTVAIPRTTPLCTATPCTSGTPAAGTSLPAAGCGILMISDHSASTGAGKTQIFQANDAMQFDAAPGSEIMCARVSTYFVDIQNNLRRADLAVNAAPALTPGGSGTRIYHNAATGIADVVTPGVIDLQFAYQVSSELFANPTIAPDQRWAFDALVGNANGVIAAPERGWFEVREVRINVLARSARPVDDTRNAEAITEGANTMENSVVVIPTRDQSIAFGRARVTTSELLTNVKLFDLNVSRGAPAEPFLRY